MYADGKKGKHCRGGSKGLDALPGGSIHTLYTKEGRGTMVGGKGDRASKQGDGMDRQAKGAGLLVGQDGV